MLSVGHMMPEEEGPKPKEEKEELCCLCLLSGVFGHETDFPFVNCVIYSCQWCVETVYIMDCPNHFFNSQNSTNLTQLLSTVYELRLFILMYITPSDEIGRIQGGWP